MRRTVRDATEPRREVTAPGHQTTYQFDAVGNRTAVTDALNQATTHVYDAINRLVSQTDPAEHTTSVSYDAIGNRLSVTDGKGATWTYTFDYANRETSMTQSDGTVEKRAWDAAGNLLAKRKPDGNVIVSLGASLLTAPLTDRRSPGTPCVPQPRTTAERMETCGRLRVPVRRPAHSSCLLAEIQLWSGFLTGPCRTLRVRGGLVRKPVHDVHTAVWLRPRRDGGAHRFRA